VDSFLKDLHEQRKGSLIGYGIILLVGFVFPIYAAGRLVFINIENLNEYDFVTSLGLVYPLVAGIIILSMAALNVKTISRPITLLGIGLFRILIGYANENDILFGNVGSYLEIRTEITLVPLIVLFLIGIFLGSKLVYMRDHISGRLIGGISGLLFLMAVLLPVGKRTIPIYFELFGVFKGGSQQGVPFSLFFYVIGLIGIFTCYISAAVISVLNFSNKPKSARNAVYSYKLAFYATVALPIIIMIAFIFGVGGSGIGSSGSLARELTGHLILTAFTGLIKLTLLFIGFIGIITTGFLDLFDQLLPDVKVREEVLSSVKDIKSGYDFADDPEKLRKAEENLLKKKENGDSDETDELPWELRDE
jgi:hypothetical protein